MPAPLRTLAGTLVLAFLATASAPCPPTPGSLTATGVDHSLTQARDGGADFSLIPTCPCSCSRKSAAHGGSSLVFAPAETPQEPAAAAGPRTPQRPPPLLRASPALRHDPIPI